MARVIERQGALTVPLCCDCKHSGDDRSCNLVGASQSFARQARDPFACGPWGNLFESGEAD